MSVVTINGECLWADMESRSIDLCPDIYTQITKRLGHKMSEVIYWGGKRELRYSDSLVERWVPRLSKYRPAFTPDVIWVRGTITKEHESFLAKYPNAIKIYYGDGKQYIPQMFTDFQIILQDCDWQVSNCNKKVKAPICAAWVKPACDTMLRSGPMPKFYDICYMPDSSLDVEWMYDTVPRDFRVLQVGESYDGTPPQNVTVKSCPKHHLAGEIKQCRIGVAPYQESYSAPTQMMEMIACGLPVVVMDGVRFNFKKCFLDPSIGAVVPSSNFWSTVCNRIGSAHKLTSRIETFYNNTLSLDRASAFIRNLIHEFRQRFTNPA